ncbi:MAG: phosphoribosyl-ATP diphosphatase [Rhodospirillales bacterium]
MNFKQATPHFLDELYEVIVSRKGGDPKESYTAEIFEAGLSRSASKIGEEATEVIVAALRETPRHVVTESADLLYHLLVLWAALEIKPADVFEELKSRAGKSGIEEKESRDEDDS